MKGNANEEQQKSAWRGPLAKRTLMQGMINEEQTNSIWTGPLAERTRKAMKIRAVVGDNALPAPSPLPILSLLVSSQHCLGGRVDRDGIF